MNARSAPPSRLLCACIAYEPAASLRHPNSRDELDMLRNIKPPAPPVGSARELCAA
jgi:hypothetical protein